MAAFLINRLPNPVLKFKTPYELLFSKVPEYSSMRVFGCLCHALTLLSHRHKFNPRLVPAAFVGYPLSYKGYKLYDLAAKKFFIFRDVVLMENVFPFHNMPQPSHVIDPFPELVLPRPVDDVSMEAAIVELATHPPSVDDLPIVQATIPFGSTCVGPV